MADVSGLSLEQRESSDEERIREKAREAQEQVSALGLVFAGINAIADLDGVDVRRRAGMRLHEHGADCRRLPRKPTYITQRNKLE